MAISYVVAWVMTSSISLQNSMKSVLTGTYVAEQRAKTAYDLLAPASDVSGTKFPKQQPKKKGYRSHEPAKCTMLPALMSLEPLLDDKSGRPDSTRTGLHSIRAGLDKDLPCYAFCHPRNDGLDQWLVPPPLSARSSGEDWRNVPRVPDYLWHILMLDKTFEVASNTVHHVADCLCLELNLDEKTAFQKVEAAVIEKVAKLATFESSKEAHRKMETLLDHGLVVRISKGVASLKDAPSTMPKRGRYTDVFNKQKLLGRKDRAALKLPRMHAASMSTGFAWRKKKEPISVISEDPVGDWFNAEQDRRADGYGDGDSSLQQNGLEGEILEEQVSHKANALRQYISKHRSTLHVENIAGKMMKMPISNEVELPETREMSVSASPEVPSRDHKVIDTDMKEACKLLRIFVFGKIGNEGATSSRERNKIFYETIGTKQEVIQLYALWRKLDIDHSGRVDIGEFRAFGEDHMKEQFQNSDVDDKIKAQVSVPSHITPRQRAAGLGDPRTFVTRLCDKLALLLLGKKSSFSFDDMLKVLWPCSDLSDLKLMKSWSKDFIVQATKTRVHTPPVLPEDDLDGLASVFSQFQKDGAEGVSVEALVSTGLIYADQVHHYLAEWGKPCQGGLTLQEFCEMMCPVGYRAHPKAKTAKLENGSRIYFDPRVNSWREEGVDDNFSHPEE